MRSEIFRMARDQAVALFERAPVVHVATTLADGTPVLRAVHGVVVDGAVAFHGAPAGEKLDALGRPAVVSAEEIVAHVPSYFVDPERACPATTLYRSVQARGALEEVTAADAKARALAALMERFQPEGGYVPIDASHPLYRKAVAGILVVRVALERVDGKAKLAQNRTPAERAAVLAGLWRRGAPGDARAVDLVRDANPGDPTPAFLAAPQGAVLRCALGEESADEAAGLLAGAYWNAGVARDALARAQRASTAWVGARCATTGALIATARALADGARHALVYDVMTADAWRGRGLGAAVIRLLLDHPAVRGARRVWLSTRDAQAFYARFGFRERAAMSPERPYPSHEMVLLRA